MLIRCPDHPKTIALCERLKINRALAVGTLELLWHFTHRYAPQGDIGRWPPIAIAKAVYWDGDPETLIEALVQERWIDRDPDRGLIVHDWSEHCDHGVHTHLAKRRLLFADGTRPYLRRFKVAVQEEIEADYAQRYGQEAVPKKAARKKKAPAVEIQGPWETFWEHYPRKDKKADAEKAWRQVVDTPEKAATILAGLKRWLSCDAFSPDRKFIATPGAWLRGRRWEDELAPPPEKTTSEREVTDDDLLVAYGHKEG